MKKFFFLLLLVTLPNFTSAGPNTPFKVNLDWARFRGDSASIYLEMYFGFDVSSLKYAPTADGYRSDAIISVTFKLSATDSIVARQAMRIPFSITDTTMLTQSRIYNDVLGFALKPDIYRVYAVLKDTRDPAHLDSVSFPFDLRSLDKSHVTLSDIELCTSIVPMEKDSTTGTNRFYKNTMEVKPNPSNLFGAHQPVLFYYLESYNLNTCKSPQYHTRATIMNSVGKEMSSNSKIKPRVYDSNVEVGMLKVGTLRTGAYVFTYSILDSIENVRYTNAKKFWVYNPSLPPDTLVASTGRSVMASEYATMTEEEVDKEFDQTRYISTKQELDHYRNLKGVDAKRQAMFDFWSKRDDGKNGSMNEAKQEHFKRIEYSNANFRSGQKEGWKTDRGRVYVMYGPPDEVERHVNEIDTKPYEIWQYHSLQGGVEFIFGDRTGFSDYVLLHSTHRNELHDENWMRQISTQ
jgi:GWxTD domain-containing protein